MGKTKTLWLEQRSERLARQDVQSTQELGYGCGRQLSHAETLETMGTEQDCILPTEPPPIKGTEGLDFVCSFTLIPPKFHLYPRDQGRALCRFNLVPISQPLNCIFLMIKNLLEKS
jgi:hypothetical protein